MIKTTHSHLLRIQKIVFVIRDQQRLNTYFSQTCCIVFNSYLLHSHCIFSTFEGMSKSANKSIFPSVFGLPGYPKST